MLKGDALAIVREMPDASVDAVVTDPPYSSGGMFRGDRAKATGSKYTDGSAARQNADFGGDSRDQRGFLVWSAMWLTEAHRVAKDDALLMAFIDWRQLPTLTDAVQAGGWIWRGIIPWHKTNARCFAGRFTNACEYVVWASKGSLPNPSDGGRAFPGIYTASSPRERVHQTQKPVELMEQLLAPVRANGVVLDPFAGSGTTGVAALNTGRDFIGVEMTDHYHAIACQRIQEAESQSLVDALLA
jgi:site-specific DNA-methyltransferase (adenine-specific)